VKIDRKPLASRRLEAAFVQLTGRLCARHLAKQHCSNCSAAIVSFAGPNWHFRASKTAEF
jgi:hypothetical protein